MKQLPNLICIFRVCLTIALSIAITMNVSNHTLLISAFWITWIIIILDGVDGIVARKLNATSDFGAFFDIACDRVVELTFISLFVNLNWIPLWILLIFLTRGIIVDGIRSYAKEKEGKNAFGEKSMMESSLGKFLTNSRFMRFTYGAIKAMAFSFMFLAKSSYPNLYTFELILIYLATAICLIRGIPVLIEGKKYFS